MHTVKGMRMQAHAAQHASLVLHSPPTCDARQGGLRHASAAGQPGGQGRRKRHLHILAQLLLRWNFSVEVLGLNPALSG